jgi:hypothetical protein
VLLPKAASISTSNTVDEDEIMYCTTYISGDLLGVDLQVIVDVSALKMEAVCSFETLITTHNSTLRDNPEDYHRHLNHCENLKSQHSMWQG